jgi:hypothetical protein
MAEPIAGDGRLVLAHGAVDRAGELVQVGIEDSQETLEGLPANTTLTTLDSPDESCVAARRSPIASWVMPARRRRSRSARPRTIWSRSAVEVSSWRCASTRTSLSLSLSLSPPRLSQMA